MSVPAVSCGRDQVFASVGLFPVVLPLLHAVDCTLCSNVCQINSATSYRKECFAATVEAYCLFCCPYMNYICFKIKLLYEGNGLGLFCPEERVNRLERSLQRHNLVWDLNMLKVVLWMLEQVV